MKRVLLLLEQKENQRLLADELAAEHEVMVASEDADLGEDFDLCILDGPALDRAWERVESRKNTEQPLFLPVLLVTSRPDVKMITRHLWRSVDELIITPIEKPELRARIEILLRAREMSVALRERAEAAEEATRVRDEVMEMVSHDLRNPLNLVLTHASLLLEGNEALKPEQRNRIEAIHRAVGQMNRLIEDLMDVTQLESGRLPLRRGPEEVEPLVRGACRQHEPAAEAASVALSCEVADGLPPVDVDRDRIDQVFGNLITNALKFAPEGTTVVVRAQAAGDAVRFSIRDTGPGIADQDRDHVFDRFWQAGGSGSDGAGLGLAIARGIVEAHGGRIGVESTPGEGAVFWFELPAA